MVQISTTDDKIRTTEIKKCHKLIQYRLESTAPDFSRGTCCYPDGDEKEMEDPGG